MSSEIRKSQDPFPKPMVLDANTIGFRLQYLWFQDAKPHVFTRCQFIPTLGTIYSHVGNILFPRWEQLVLWQETLFIVFWRICYSAVRKVTEMLKNEDFRLNIWNFRKYTLYLQHLILWFRLFHETTEEVVCVLQTTSIFFANK